MERCYLHKVSQPRSGLQPLLADGDRAGEHLECSARLDGRRPRRVDSLYFLPPNGTATLEGYIENGWDASDVEFYTNAYYENFHADTMLPYLRINGTEEYWRALDQNLSEAMIGRLNAQEALDKTAAAWEGTTERCGLEQQLQQYQEATGYQP